MEVIKDIEVSCYNLSKLLIIFKILQILKINYWKKKAYWVI